MRRFDESYRLHLEAAHQETVEIVLARLNEMADQDPTASATLFATFSGAIPDPGGGWWAIYGYAHPHRPAEEFRIWRITRRGAQRTAKRKCRQLTTIRGDVLEAQMKGH